MRMQIAIPSQGPVLRLRFRLVKGRELSHPTSLTRKRSGAVAVWLLVSLLVILGIVAIGMDGGRMMEKRRHAQATADAAALAAAEQLFLAEHPSLTGSSKKLRRSRKRRTARDAALDVAKANGFDNDGKTSIVQFNWPPKSGEFAGRTDCVEIIVQYNLGGTFSGIFKKNTLPVKARAVALGRTMPVGVVVLKRNGANAFLNEAAAFTLVNSRMYINSTHQFAFKQKKPGLVVADAFNIAGGADTGGAIIVGDMNTGTRQVGDPLRDLPVPTSVSVQSKTQLVPGIKPKPLLPGIYRGGIKINALVTVMMLPGVYILEGGGLEVNAGGSLIGTEVMIYNTNGAAKADSIDMKAGSIVALTAPTSGDYQGVSIFQDRAVTDDIKLTDASISGTIYAPAADVKLIGNVVAGITLGGAYVVDSLDVSGVGAINIDLGGNRPPIPEIALVE